MVNLLLETKFKDGHKIKLFEASDGRHYIQRFSVIAGENNYFEWLTNADYTDVWQPALEIYGKKHNCLLFSYFLTLFGTQNVNIY